MAKHWDLFMSNNLEEKIIGKFTKLVKQSFLWDVLQLIFCESPVQMSKVVFRDWALTFISKSSRDFLDFLNF